MWRIKWRTEYILCLWRWFPSLQWISERHKQPLLYCCSRCKIFACWIIAQGTGGHVPPNIFTGGHYHECPHYLTTEVLCWFRGILFHQNTLYFNTEWQRSFSFWGMRFTDTDWIQRVAHVHVSLVPPVCLSHWWALSGKRIRHRSDKSLWENLYQSFVIIRPLQLGSDVQNTPKKYFENTK